MAIALNLALAAFQVVVAGLIYGADGLSLTFGVTWSLGMALAMAAIVRMGSGWPGGGVGAWRLAACCLLMMGGLLAMAYSRHLLVLYVGWEIAGLGLWLALSQAGGGGRRWLAVALHAPGWVLLALALLGLAPVLAPPMGGVAQDWPLPLAVALAGVTLARAGCWPFNGWPREAISPTEWHSAGLLGLYCLAAPFLLAKALVAAGWTPAGTWAMALLGTLGLVGGATAAVSLRGARRVPAIASAHAGAALAGLALAPGSPVAAAGAIALLVSGTLWVATLPGLGGTGWLAVAGGWSALLGGSVGVWAIAQGAFGLGYGVIAVILLPAGALLALSIAGLRRGGSAESWPKSLSAPVGAVGDVGAVREPPLLVLVLGVAACLFVGIYPQAMIEWVARPAVTAMPGGVGAVREVSSAWGVGVEINSPTQTFAALPATGMVLGVALALVALYWLKLLVGRFAPTGETRRQKAEGSRQRPLPSEMRPRPSADSEPAHDLDLSMDAILPGAELAGRWLDPATTLTRLVPRFRNKRDQ